MSPHDNGRCVTFNSPFTQRSSHTLLSAFGKGNSDEEQKTEDGEVEGEEGDVVEGGDSNSDNSTVNSDDKILLGKTDSHGFLRTAVYTFGRGAHFIVPLSKSSTCQCSTKK